MGSKPRWQSRLRRARRRSALLFWRFETHEDVRWVSAVLSFNGTTHVAFVVTCRRCASWACGRIVAALEDEARAHRCRRSTFLTEVAAGFLRAARLRDLRAGDGRCGAWQRTFDGSALQQAVMVKHID